MRRRPSKDVRYYIVNCIHPPEDQAPQAFEPTCESRYQTLG